MYDISLKWKVLLPVVFALAISASVIFLQSQKSLAENYRNSQNKLFEQNTAISRGLVGDIRATVYQSHRLLEYFFRYANHAASDVDSQALRALWQLLEQTEVDDLQLYTVDGQLLQSYTHPSEDMASLVSQFPWDELKKAAAYDEFVACLPVCHIYYRAQYELRSGEPLIAFIAVSLDTLVTQFELLSTTVLTMLSAQPWDGFEQQSLWVDSFKAYIGSSTQFYWALDVLKQVPAFDQEEYDGTPFVLNSNGRVWSIRLAPTEYRGIYQVFMDDVTEQQAEYTQARRNAAFVVLGVGAALLSAIYLLVNPPLRRLREIGHIIPLLGSSEFARFREVIGKPRKERVLHDELGLIHQTAYTVSEKLERLEVDILKQAEALQAALVQASDHHKFLRYLIDHSEVAIIALDANFQVTLSNQLVAEISRIPVSRHPGLTLGVLFGTEAGSEMEEKFGEDALAREPYENYFDVGSDGRYYEWIYCRLPHVGLRNTAYLLVGVDVTERRVAERRTRYLAEYDELTKCFNRRTFTEHIQALLIKNENVKGFSFALMYVDLNRFKAINDHLGHHTGDLYLRQVVVILEQNTPENAIIGRLGGDEFGVVMPGVDEFAARRIAEILSAKLSDPGVESVPKVYCAGAAIGIALAPQHGKYPQLLIRNADTAMYIAKSSPDQNFEVFSTLEKESNQLYSPLDKRLYVISLIREEMLDIYVQPIISIEDQSIIACECLTRARSDEGQEAIHSDELFMYAVQGGVIEELDRYIFLRIAKLMGASDHTEEMSGYWELPFNQNFRVSINLSGHSITRPAFAQYVQEVGDTHQIDWEKIVIEVTESEWVQDVKAASEFLEMLKNRGAKVALDDFGDGFAGLNYLRNFPCDWVKIDGQFIRNIDHHYHDQVIVQAVVNVAQKLGMKVAAECVETKEVYDYLKAVGVDYSQGWLHGKAELISSLGE